MEVRDPDLGTSPRCGARFVTRNMSHGCGEYTVDGFFEGKPTRLRLYDALVALMGELGPFEQVPTKTRIAFMVRVRFAAVNRVRKDGLVCHIWLRRRIESPRFTKVELVGRTDWIHHFVLRSEEELDDEVRGWIGEAYDVGKQRISPGSEYGGNVKDHHLARTFVQRAGLETRPSITQVVEAIRKIPYARPTERTAEGVVAEWRGTCSTKTALLVRLTRYWCPELEPRVAHRLYHLTSDSARTLFGPRVASAIPQGGITDVHTYATLHLEEGRVVVDVTFPGVAWDGSSDMPLSCGDGKDVDGGVDPWETKARLVSEHCDPLVRDTFIEALSS